MNAKERELIDLLILGVTSLDDSALSEETATALGWKKYTYGDGCGVRAGVGWQGPETSDSLVHPFPPLYASSFDLIEEYVDFDWCFARSKNGYCVNVYDPNKPKAAAIFSVSERSPARALAAAVCVRHKLNIGRQNEESLNTLERE